MNPHDPKGAVGLTKDPLEMVPSFPLRASSRVLRLGASKYGKYNWRDNNVCSSTYMSAMMRHLQEWNDGADEDEESKEHPLAHVIASAMIVLDAIQHETLIDDRWKPCNLQLDSKTAKSPTSAEAEPEDNTETNTKTACDYSTSLPASGSLHNLTEKSGLMNWTRCDGSPFTIPSNIGLPNA